MKKLLSITLCLIMLLSLASCGNKDDNASSNNNSSESSIVSEASKMETPSSVSADTPGEQTASVAAIADAVKAAYAESYIPSMSYSKEEISEKFGLTEDMYDDIIAEGPMISVHVDTFIAVHAKPNKTADVETALNNYRQSLIDNLMQYPMNQIKIQASVVESMGDYVFFIMLGEIPTSIEEQGEEETLKYAQQENQIAIDTIKSVLTGSN